MKKVLQYAISGIGYGSFAYLIVLLFNIQLTRPTAANILSILLMSAGIGLLALIFEGDWLPELALVGIHLLGSLGLVMAMIWYNDWTFGPLFWLVFIALYIVIWALVRLNRYLQVEKINQKLKQRRLP
ncbi:DUF3021 domain-containing protein [Lactiplantibacillus daowaiensis]|uniref:DUF3021 domain-containing protein n=1 Tax=Lactiplantibacillus daowaiensis TaxID=2559918 RepID=A0ABW1RYX6_9LACO|nr:DUF3021 domain-containing protein [Lactiplantibacillus daowaiensis]